MVGSLPESQSPFVKSFSCRNCHAAVTIQNLRDSVVAICNSCHSTIDLTDPNYRILVAVNEKVNYKPSIPLGSRGRIHGSLWEVIGYLHRIDLESEYGWDEFLLFNPYQGYRWLTQAQGHWNFVTPIKERPLSYQVKQNSCYYQGETYKLFYSGKARVNRVLGEFYWRVRTNDVIEMSDYIAPPRMLSLERDSSEQNWSVSEYLETEEVQRAFNLQTLLSRPIGVAPNQPSKPAVQWTMVLKQAGILYALLFLFQLMQLISSANESAFRYVDTYSGQTKTIVTPPFELKHGLGNITLTLDAPVNDTWLSLDGDIVNEKTGENFPFTETAEYYHGYDSGESWQEGSNEKTELYSALPSGVYHLEYTMTGAGLSDTSRYVQVAPTMDYSLVLNRQVPMWSNFWWVFFLLMVYPLWCWFRKYSFEVTRWSTSDYSPYNAS